MSRHKSSNCPFNSKGIVAHLDVIHIVEPKTMAWFKLNDSLNTLKGQITNVSNVVQEVFSEAIIDEDSVEPVAKLEEAVKKIDDLTNLCSTQDNEVMLSFLSYCRPGTQYCVVGIWFGKQTRLSFTEQYTFVPAN